MKHYKIFLLAVLSVPFFTFCGKNGDDGPNGENYNYGTGFLFQKSGTDGLDKIDMSTGIKASVLPNKYNWYGWDIGWDGTKGIQRLQPTSTEPATTYVFFNTSNGSITSSFKYTPFKDDNGGLPALSSDGSMIALRPGVSDGIVILTARGALVKHLTAYLGQAFGYLDPIYWMPDNTILFRIGMKFYRTNSTFTAATLIKEFSFSKWHGFAAVSPNGAKIAVMGDDHVWLMNADGSDLHQITESNQDEPQACFSPDGKYLAVESNARAPQDGGNSGNAYHIAIVPADGQRYKMWPGEDNRVRILKIKGEPGMAYAGDFVWR